MDYQSTYKDILEIIQDHFQLSLDAQLEIFEEQIPSNLFDSFSISSEAKDSLKKLLRKMNGRRQEVHRKNVFLERNNNLLTSSITISVSNLTNFLKTRVVTQDGQFNVIFSGFMQTCWRINFCCSR